jgi:hypothetical protein
VLGTVGLTRRYPGQLQRRFLVDTLGNLIINTAISSPASRALVLLFNEAENVVSHH